ncbi:MAG: membrane protein insertase YidC [Mycobacteriales bacterium]
MSVFDVLAQPVAFVLKGIHTGLSTVLPAGSGWAWGLSIVLLTITVRILLFPLFVKQIKSQRRMQELSPKIKALQAKHKGDRETLNTELMKLYKDHGANPVSGCLPLVLQLPIFFALFRVMNEFKPHFHQDKTAYFTGKYGLSDTLIEQAAKAKVFGAPISAAFNSKASLLTTLHGDAGTVKVVAVLMIVAMGATTFFTQRQMMARNGAPADPQQAQVQKIMLYVLPFSFAIFGFSFPVGVLLYWLTTNIWSMGQQRWVIARMPPVVPGSGGPAKGGAGADGKGPGKAPGKGPGKGPEKDAGPAGPSGTSKDDSPQTAAETAITASTGSGTDKPPTASRPSAGRAAGSRKNKSRKGGRR